MELESNITMAMAILLGTGFLAAKIGNIFRLPSVTGYICAGLLLGPSGLHLIPTEMVSNQLGHFSQIALMMIAFGIVEHLEIRRHKETLKKIIFIALSETSGAFILVFLGSFAVAYLTNIGPPTWTTTHYFIVAILLAAVSLATAPASTLHVIREAKASGPLTTTLMAVVAVDNSLAIIMFGITLSIARHLMEAGNSSIFMVISTGFIEISASLALGFVAGLIIDFIDNRLKHPGEMLTAGLAILLLCGELAQLLNLSSLLAGMAAGFTIVNREHRDIRLFRALNSFEPPIYVLFFTLAGIHLNINSLATAGWLGLAYFLCRSMGKIIGASIGAKITAAPQSVHRYLGMALTPQAGVAIGLIFLVNSDPEMKMFSTIIIPVVLTGVFFSELIGPIFAKQAVKLAGEIPSKSAPELPRYTKSPYEPTGVPMVPWTWEKLKKPLKKEGVVLFGANHIATTRALARMAAIFANYYEASPMAVRIIPDTELASDSLEENGKAIMFTAKAEMLTMGTELYAAIQRSNNTAQGILTIARQNNAHNIVLGHCQKMTPTIFQKVIGEVISHAPCPTIVIKFSGILHTERILVPVITMRDLHPIRDIIRALAIVGQHKITLLQLLPSYEVEASKEKATNRLRRWAEHENLSNVTHCQALTTEARQETIITESEHYDLVIMAGPRQPGLHRLFFGSLLNAVSAKCNKTLITVYPASN